jgi:Skp family chaperone for outer membrane proteins
MLGRSRLFFAIISLMMVAAASYAQTAQASPKIGFINSDAFYDEKDGVRKLINAYKTLDTETKPQRDALVALGNRIELLQKELATLQEQASKNVPIDRNAANAKSDEFERLKREYQFKSEDYKAVTERRRQAIVGPVSQEIATAIREFATQKGLAVIMDYAKLAETGLLLHYTEAADSTKEFIAYINARPATTPTTPARTTPTRPGQ